MRAVVQRVSRASVTVEGEPRGTISQGFVVLLGIERSDTEADLDWLANKVPQLRVFEDEEGKMNLDLLVVDGEMIVVSQFTLFGNVRKGTRPSFNRSAAPDHAIPLYEAFISKMEARLGKMVVTGEFGAMMEVDLVNDGPVTLVIDTQDKRF
ncbi:D-tyrosyl-tRNA(Tyr) deacylase [Opitutia bacterium ISCC 51]|nr:D-tyrosyl-tRNA(Tyr) deacylase [Opitutae bacterium ISCC 51]QXD26622.1 D-tyrosyl-tRNA(Tyr) deacylase [Opitutae bacterium ISCC 52]